jgi:hypothetical protein
MSEQTVLGWGAICAGSMMVLGWALLWTGRWRADWVRDYRATGAPAWRRNRAFASLPAGVIFVSGGLIVLMPESWFGFTALLLLVGILFPVACVLALVIVFTEPPWAKPAWVRELDRCDWQGFQPAGKHIGRALRVLTLSVVAAFVVALVHRATIWDFIAPLLMGVAASIGVGVSGRQR